jgi:hypothetical protein
MLTHSLCALKTFLSMCHSKLGSGLRPRFAWRGSGPECLPQEQHLDGRSVWLSAKAPLYREQNSPCPRRGREARAAIPEAKGWASLHLSKAHAEYAPDSVPNPPTPDRTRSSLDSPRESDQRAYRTRNGGVSSSTVVGDSIYYWVLTVRHVGASTSETALIV